MSKIDDIINLKFKDAGETMRRDLARQMYEQITRPSPLYEKLIKDLPKPTRWQQFKNRMFWKIENFRIWLSKRIYDWSDYEDK